MEAEGVHCPPDGRRRGTLPSDEGEHPPLLSHERRGTTLAGGWPPRHAQVGVAGAAEVPRRAALGGRRAAGS